MITRYSGGDFFLLSKFFNFDYNPSRRNRQALWIFTICVFHFYLGLKIFKGLFFSQHVLYPLFSRIKTIYKWSFSGQTALLYLGYQGLFWFSLKKTKKTKKKRKTLFLITNKNYEILDLPDKNKKIKIKKFEL